MGVGEFSQARDAFAQAALDDPTAGALWRNLAHACRSLGDDSGEHAALDRALELDRRDLVANLRLAQLHQRAGDDTSAFGAWAGVIELTSGLAADLPQSMLDEVAAGQAYVADLEGRLATSVFAARPNMMLGLDAAEQHRVDVFIDGALGQRRIYENQCAGVRYPFLPAHEFFDRKHFPWLENFEHHTDAIWKECTGLLDGRAAPLRPYVRQEAGTPHNVWTPLDQSPDWSALFLWEFGQPDDDAIAACPATVAALADVPLCRISRRAPNVFFSILAPGTRIPPHTGVTNARTIVHLPLSVPDGCGFRVGGDLREWEKGRCLAFDDTIEHEAWNEGTRPRAVLIFDVWNPYMSAAETEAVRAYFAAADQAGFSGDWS